MDGARGFFVALLTGTSPIADEPPDWLIAAFFDREETAAELLVKNLAMSSATALSHRRSQDARAEEGSQLVARRSAHAIERFRSPVVKQYLGDLLAAVENRQSERTTASEAGAAVSLFHTFLSRWSYDSEQLQAIKSALLACV
jgi:hypothetical protein